MNKSRVEAFTDAIIAIVMTVLVLGVAQPKSDTWHSLELLLPHLGIYIVSFIILAIYWNNHHHLFQMVKRVNGSVLWANNFFLLSVSFVPVGSSWISEYPNSFVPQLFYAVTFLLANSLYLLLTYQLMRANPEELSISQSTIKKNIFSVVINLSFIVIGYFTLPILMMIAQIFVFAFWLIPDRHAEKKINQ